MLLCADIGNSHTTIGLLDGGVVVDHWRMATDERREILRIYHGDVHHVWEPGVRPASPS
jgi:pantothenate kinase type III